MTKPKIQRVDLNGAVPVEKKEVPPPSPSPDKPMKVVRVDVSKQKAPKAIDMKEFNQRRQELMDQARDPEPLVDTSLSLDEAYKALLDRTEQATSYRFGDSTKGWSKRPVVRSCKNKPVIPEGVTRVHFYQQLSPGDVLMFTAALRDLHKAYPGRFETCVTTSVPELLENNPYIQEFPDSPGVLHIESEYPLVNNSSDNAYHFLHGYHLDMEEKLGVRIPVTRAWADLHLTEEEENNDIVAAILGGVTPYWIINAGSKSDYTAKQWSTHRFQRVVETRPMHTFVQIGAENHNHTRLTGDNVVDLVGKTSHRELLSVMRHAAGVITGVSYPMHLSPAVPMHPRFKRQGRPCIVLAGGREAPQWEQYGGHVFLNTAGKLPCCDGRSGRGCWKSRVTPLRDGDEKDHPSKMCLHPVDDGHGQIIPLCLNLIGSPDVVDAMDSYLQCYDYSGPVEEWKVRI